MGNRQNRHADYRTPPEDIVTWVVLSLNDFPVEMRPAKLRHVVDFYREMFKRSNVPCPEWVGMLAALAEERAGAGDSREEPGPKH